jgi:TatD DNase family protein
MIDSHCHLAGEEFAADLEAVVGRARDAGVTRALCILSAGDIEEAERAGRVRAVWPTVQFAAGVHPHQAGDFAGRVDEAVRIVRQVAGDHGVCAIGEIGLDYHYDFSPREVQRDVFRAQLDVAVELELPVVIHTREATEDTFEILRDAGVGRVRGVFHCFTGDEAMARSAFDLDFYLSFAGIVTFPRADVIRAAAKMTPAERILAETDAPYLAPVPHRGKRNEPAFVAEVVEKLAGIREVPVADLAGQVSRNFDALFGTLAEATD